MMADTSLELKYTRYSLSNSFEFVHLVFKLTVIDALSCHTAVPLQDESVHSLVSWNVVCCELIVKSLPGICSWQQGTVRSRLFAFLGLPGSRDRTVSAHGRASLELCGVSWSLRPASLLHRSSPCLLVPLLRIHFLMQILLSLRILVLGEPG